MKIAGNALSKIDRDSDLYQKLLTAHTRIQKLDPMTWGEAASTEAAIRLNWVNLPSASRDLLPVLDALCAKFRNKNRIVLAGMGGSSLAPEVIAHTFNKEIFILDSTDPQYVAQALSGDLSKTLLIVSSKSGSTIETASARSAFEKAFTDSSLPLSEHIVIVTDPDSPLDQEARTQSLTVINADPHVGGRFSALTAFGLVPAALIGVDVSLLLDSAADTKESFIEDPYPLIDTAWAISALAGQYLGFTDQGSGLPGISDWIEQLIAESTGKSGVGRLPVVAESVQSAKVGDAFTISFVESEADLSVTGELGEHFIFWEWVTALVGVALGVDPFNQPNVTEAKNATSSLLAEWGGIAPIISSEVSVGDVEIFGAGNTLEQALTQFVAAIPIDGYISIHAYLDRNQERHLLELRSLLAKVSGRPVTFGWGPRFLHSTGQFHKGGQQNGAFLQITGAAESDIAIPGKNFGFKTLVLAQALGDNNALAERKFPLLRLNLINRSAGITQILNAAKTI
jgi:glucose-6-phosphate isomerase